MNTTLLLVGCGKMGGAMLDGWLARGLDPDRVWIVEPNAETAADLASRLGVHTLAGADGLPADLKPDVVLFAVKPQVMDQAMPPYARLAGPDTVFLSIAAGRTLASFGAALGDHALVVRSMPNTPAAVGRGITVCCAGPGVTEAQRALCQSLLEAVGAVDWVEDESLIDAVTAVSGSGPAYVFLLTECLARAGARLGLPPDLAARLARATVSGAGELMHQAPDDPAVLRQNVTSPGGTTAAALAVLMDDDGLQPLMDAAVTAAERRSRELAG
ncbi:MAG: pyrroline-5-carboxylate reductase [Rhodobacterales bacterium]|nr:pyrroline-5-carboxylate reductase [Rhodobacterales bacterium]